MLVLLLLVVLVAAGCVLWFMYEAMRNERMAVREKLAEAYRGHLLLVQTQMMEDWHRQLGQIDGAEADAVRFARCIREGLADSAICFDEQGQPGYPRLPSAADSQGRDVAANTELSTLESLVDKSDPQFRRIAAHLGDLVNDYQGSLLPSAQRRFIMHELGRLNPDSKFPTLAAEELAARYLEGNPVFVREPVLHATDIREVWSMITTNRRTIALFTTAGLQARLANLIHDQSLPRGVKISALTPSQDAGTKTTLVTSALASELPGWRLSLSLDDDRIFDTETAKRVKVLVAVACLVIAAMSVLSLIIARSFGKQVQLTRLKNDLVANVSHELKTPLTAMRALVDTLLDTERFDEKTTREYLQLLATENARLSRLIDNFLTFSRLERNKYTFAFGGVRPQQVVDGAVAAMGERARAAGCTLESEVAANLPLVYGDADALVTALLNLLNNAWKYSGDEKHIMLRVAACNGNICFAVTDNGVGLSPRESQRVFRRFYQSDQTLARAVGGCGLGLSIVRSIVEAHRGSVRVESEPGSGSTFTIEIPAVTEDGS